MKLLAAIFWIILISGMFIGVMMLRDPTSHLPIADITPVEETELYCYEPYGAIIEPKYILNGTIVAVEFIDAGDMPDGTEAYARWSVDFDANVSYCVITAVLPEHMLGDPRMDALGHELLHCLTGEFHP